jgi:pimeloyl-ACP methyl ester carboxylesterase
LAPYRAVLVDLLGSGLSSAPTDFAYTLEAHAASIAQLLDELKLRNCHVIGHSLGGSVAIILAAMRPDLVAGFVVSEPNLEPRDATGGAAIAALSEADFVATGYAAFVARVEAGTRANPGGESYLRSVQLTNPRVLYRSAISLVAASLTDTFLGLSMPRTYLVGELSLPHWHVDLLRERGVPVVVVPNAVHGTIFKNEEFVGRAIAETLPT